MRPGRPALTVFCAGVACAPASASLLGIQIREDKTLPAAVNLPPGLRTFNLYAKFDGPGGASGPNRVNTVLAVTQPSSVVGWGLNLAMFPGANFFQASAANGATANNVWGPDLANPSPTLSRGLHDSWVSIGRKHRDSRFPEEPENPPLHDDTGPDPDFLFVNSDGVSGHGSLGLGAGHDFVRGGWLNGNPPGQQGAAVSNNGKFETLLAQVSVSGVPADVPIWYDGNQPNAATAFLTNIFCGELTIVTQGPEGGPATTSTRITFICIPAPGAMALVSSAAVLAGLRRRR